MKLILALLLTTSSTFAQVAGPSSNFLPSGMVSAFALNSCPVGWVEANGGTPLRSLYPRLFAAMGTIHGNGNGTTTFHLPDYRGRFLRGVDKGAGNDADRTSRVAMNAGGAVGDAVGSVQDDMFQGHDHNLRYSNVSSGSSVTDRVSIYANNAGPSTSSTMVTNPVTGSHGTPRYGWETRPKNATVIYCVKI